MPKHEAVKKKRKEGRAKNETMKKKRKESRAKNETMKKKETMEKKECEGEMEKKKQRKSSFITDARFASAQLDPRFRLMPKHEAKIPVDSRFSRMLSDRNFSSSSAPVDKRGKAKKGKGVNPLSHYYLHEKEPRVDEVENANTVSTSSDVCTDESSSTTEDEDEDDDDNPVNSDLFHYLMANHEDTPTTEQETHRLAVVNMDWEHIKEHAPALTSLIEPFHGRSDSQLQCAWSAHETHDSSHCGLQSDYRKTKLLSVDIYVVMSSCLPKGGQILSVTIYPSEFGLKCMEVEALHGPASLIDADGEESEDEPDPEVINEKLRSYELNKLRYYYAVAVFDSSATANHVYNTLDGTELTRTSNVFDLRFVPDSMEFKHPSRDLTTAAPTNYKQPDFQTFALQHNKVKLTWEDDEPQRVKTLRRKFKAEELHGARPQIDASGKNLLNDEDTRDRAQPEEEDRKRRGWGKRTTLLNLNPNLRRRRNAEKLRSLLDPSNHSGTDQSENDMDMEITFNTGLEDLSKRIFEKKDKKSETVWEQVLRKRSEKRNARKNWSKDLSDDEDSDYDVKELPEQPDDFFVEESSDTDLKPVKKRNKVSKDRKEHNKLREQQSQEVDKEQEASRAELELLFADDQEIGKGPKGYNINAKKVKGHKGKEITGEKLPSKVLSSALDPNSSAFALLYSLYPTRIHFVSSASFALQVILKGCRDHMLPILLTQWDCPLPSSSPSRQSLWLTNSPPSRRPFAISSAQFSVRRKIIALRLQLPASRVHRLQDFCRASSAASAKKASIKCSEEEVSTSSNSSSSSSSDQVLVGVFRSRVLVADGNSFRCPRERSGRNRGRAAREILEEQSSGERDRGSQAAREIGAVKRRERSGQSSDERERNYTGAKAGTQLWMKNQLTSCFKISVFLKSA
ncbi:hypothetical protein KSP39_PZI019968 [Platanthera zijinensis]|uniref:ESF1 RRM domain-containing protein n=1 Tax=Platanthera zijinensis TaxID=2320716 RepID=A0AAP0FWZ2_9ASPA